MSHVAQAPLQPQPRQSVSRALLIQRLRTPAILAGAVACILLLSQFDHLVFGIPPSPKPERYRLTGWSPDGCFLATPVTGGGPVKRVFPLHMTHRGPSDLPAWLTAQDVYLRRTPSPTQTHDQLLAHSITDTDHGFDLMARLIIQGWLVPLPNQTLDTREQAFVQQCQWNRRMASGKKQRSND